MLHTKGQASRILCTFILHEFSPTLIYSVNCFFPTLKSERVPSMYKLRSEKAFLKDLASAEHLDDTTKMGCASSIVPFTHKLLGWVDSEPRKSDFFSTFATEDTRSGWWAWMRHSFLILQMDRLAASAPGKGHQPALGKICHREVTLAHSWLTHSGKMETWNPTWKKNFQKVLHPQSSALLMDSICRRILLLCLHNRLPWPPCIPCPCTRLLAPLSCCLDISVHIYTEAFLANNPQRCHTLLDP